MNRGNQIIGLIYFSIFITILAGLLFHYNQSRQNRNIKDVTYTNQIIQETTSLLSYVKDTETGQRGYILTGEKSYLNPYEQGLYQIDVSYKNLSVLTQGDSSYKSALGRIKVLIDKKKGFMASVIQLYNDKGQDEAIKLIKTDQGEIYMDNLRTVIAEINGEETGKQKANNKWLKETIEFINISTSASLIFIIIILIGSSLVISKSIAANKQLITELDSQNAQLEIKVKDRTIELEEINNELRATEEELRQQNETVNATNDQLYIINEQLEGMVEREKEKQNELAKLNQIKDNILGVVAHDLRNPINAITGLSTLLKMSLNDTSTQHDPQEYIQYIDNSCKKATEIIQDLLEITELESITYELKKDYTDLHQLIKNCIKIVEPVFTEKKIEFKFHPSNEDIFLYINPAKFARVIDNLVSNALKFTHEGGIISLTTEKKEDKILIKIKDSGIGMSTDMQKIIFEKFSKTRRAGTKGEKSTGLGMSIVKQIIDLHDGNIWVESIENEGTIFFIELPLTIV